MDIPPASSQQLTPRPHTMGAFDGRILATTDRISEHCLHLKTASGRPHGGECDCRVLATTDRISEHCLHLKTASGRKRGDAPSMALYYSVLRARGEFRFDEVKIAGRLLTA